MYFTKTKFKNAMFCPTTLNYVDKDNYKTSMDENAFLKGIAEGGYQVEYLAKSYFPDGIDLSDLSLEDNVKETKRLISENENIVIFEPCFIINNFLVRCDILEKKDYELHIYEVKAKAFDFNAGEMEILKIR